MTVRSKAEELVNRVTPVLILIVCCLSSLLIATNVRCHGSLALYLYDDLPKYAERHEVHWLGATHGMFVFLFVPLIAGVIDHFKLSYRICMVSSGLLGLLSCILSAGFSDPGYMIVTDTVVAGGAASVMLSTIILVIDDTFPVQSSLRIFATTMVQGVAFATFFLIDGYSMALKLAGWRAVFYAYGVSICCLGILGGVLFARPTRPRQGYSPLPAASSQRSSSPASQRRRRADDTEDEEDGRPNSSFSARSVVSPPAAPGTTLIAASDPSVIDQIFERKDWKKRLLSLSQAEMDSSRTSLLWISERLLAAIISDGVFLFLLLHSGIAQHPFIIGSATPTPRLDRITTAFIFTVGSTSSYLGGGILGCLIRGRLLIVTMAGALITLCALIGWVAVLDTFYHGELVFAWFCGVGIGAINTFSYAASEEATGIAARSIFPFTKLARGLSVVTIEVTHSAITSSEETELQILLIVLLLLTLAEFALLILIRRINHRLDASARRFSSRRQWRTAT